MVKLGQRLQEERKRKGLSLDEVASATKIRAEFLSSIEKGDYEKLPSQAYAQGFVTNYAEYLGFSRKESIALFKRDFDERKAMKVLPDSFTRQKAYRHTTFRIQRSGFALGAIFIFLLSYLFFQYRSVFFNPPLTVNEPSDKVTVGQNITVRGSTDPNAVVSVNGEIVSVDDNGVFNKSLTLLPGTTQIEIIAKNRYGKTTTVDRIVNVK